MINIPQDNGLNKLEFVNCNNNGSEKKEEIFRKNKELNIEEFLGRKIVLESKPLRLGVIVTNFCNLRCIMCPESRYKGGSTLPESAMPKIEELLPYLERIDWQGGEFFVFRHLRKLFHSCKAYQNITHEITTNGLLLDEEWIELFLELNTGLTFSIDSTVKNTYEYIRQGGNFDTLLNNLNLIKGLEQKYHKKLRRNITVVVMKSNYRHLRNFVDFAKQFGFGSLLFTPVLFWDNEENIFTTADYDAGYLSASREYIKNKCLESNISFSWNLPFSSAVAETKIGQQSLPAINASGLFCNYPWKALWVGVEREGNIYPDCWCEQPIGNIFEDRLLEAWNSEKMQEYRKLILASDTAICRKDCISTYSATVNCKCY